MKCPWHDAELVLECKFDTAGENFKDNGRELIEVAVHCMEKDGAKDCSYEAFTFLVLGDPYTTRLDVWTDGK